MSNLDILVNKFYDKMKIVIEDLEEITGGTNVIKISSELQDAIELTLSLYSNPSITNNGKKLLLDIGNILKDMFENKTYDLNRLNVLVRILQNFKSNEKVKLN